MKAREQIENLMDDDDKGLSYADLVALRELDTLLMDMSQAVRSVISDHERLELYKRACAAGYGEK